MNNGKYHTQEYKNKQAVKTDRMYGPILKHQKTCQVCNKSFLWEGRKNTKSYERANYCSRSCANSIGGKSKSEKYHTDDVAHYTTVAFRYHKKICCVCGEDKIVAVHHYDEDHQNNDPKNLVPLCPTHHQYMHSRYRIEIESIVKEYIKNNWAVGVVGGTRALQA